MGLKPSCGCFAMIKLIPYFALIALFLGYAQNTEGNEDNEFEKFSDFILKTEMTFRKLAFFKSQSPNQFGRIRSIKYEGELNCSVKMKNEEFGNFYASFFSSKSPTGQKYFDLYMFTPSKVTTRKLKYLVGNQDFGYIFDRNQDGKIDLFSYNVGTAQQLPFCIHGKVFNKAGSAVINASIGAHIICTTTQIFWHLADNNFDGKDDGLIIRLMNESTGWIDGWMHVYDIDFDGIYDSCNWYLGKLGENPRACTQTKDGFSVPGWKFWGMEKCPGDFDWLQMINDSLPACIKKSKLPKNLLESPESFIGEKVVLLEQRCLPTIEEEAADDAFSDIESIQNFELLDLAEQYLDRREIANQLEKYKPEREGQLGTILGTKMGYQLVLPEEIDNYESAVEKLLSNLSAAIDQYGFANIEGDWTIQEMSACDGLPDPWVSQRPETITISQHAMGIEINGRLGVVINDLILFDTGRGEKLSLIGKVTSDSIFLRPAADITTRKWSLWSRPPSYEKMQNCQIKLKRR